jgi:hypothetical protein
MKRRLIATITALLILGVTSAWADTIYLKNGSVIKGEIIETTPGVSYKIETRDGSIFVFKMEDIEKIVFRAEKPVKKVVPAEEIEFSIIPYLGSWEPKKLEERDMLYGVNCRWTTEKDVAFQFEFARWSHREEVEGLAAEASCNILGLTGLYFIKSERVPTIIPYLGGGVGFYFWHAELKGLLKGEDDDSGIGFHLCGGSEFVLSENFSLGLELRQIVTGETSDWDWDFTGLIFGGKATFTF